MALLTITQRYLGLVLIGVLFAPLIGSAVLPKQTRPGEAASTTSLEACRSWVACPAAVDGFLEARFGFREPTLQANAWLHHQARSPSSHRVIYGKGEQLFYADEKVIQQTAGTVFRREGLDLFVHVASAISRDLTRHGGSLVVAPPPNPHSVEVSTLPDWISPRAGAPNELSYLIENLRTAQVEAVDLRPVLKNVRLREPVYFKTDTHWNSLGALLSLNTILAQVNRHELRQQVDDLLQKPAIIPGGDLARFIGMSDFLSDTQRTVRPLPRPRSTMKSLNVFRGNTEVFPGLSDIALEVGSDGPAIMVLGDSYTRHYWVDFLLRNTSRVAWMHHRNCAFDYGAVIRFKPDLLIWAPVERATACQRWPDGLKDRALSQVQTVHSLPSELDLELKTETAQFEQVFRFPDTSLQGLSFDDVADLRRTVRGIEFRALNDPKIFFEMNSIGASKSCVHLRVKVRLSVPNGGLSQLFYRTVGEGQFSEKNSRTMAVDPGDGEGAKTVIFDIVEPRGFAARLRFDPVLRSQEVVLNDLEVWCGS